LKFKKNLAQLKDMMFARIRENSGQGRIFHQEGRVGRHERNSYSKSQVC
jgi:hypothetical protein